MLGSAPMEITLIPLLSDNYGYLLHDAASKQTAVVDPSEAAGLLIHNRIDPLLGDSWHG